MTRYLSNELFDEFVSSSYGSQRSTCRFSYTCNSRFSLTCCASSCPVFNIPRATFRRPASLLTGSSVDRTYFNWRVRRGKYWQRTEERAIRLLLGFQLPGCEALTWYDALEVFSAGGLGSVALSRERLIGDYQRLWQYLRYQLRVIGNNLRWLVRRLVVVVGQPLESVALKQRSPRPLP